MNLQRQHLLKVTSFRCYSNRSLENVLSRGPKKYTFSNYLNIWFRSFSPNRLKILQDELTSMMLPKSVYKSVNIKNKKVEIDEEGNYINEILLEQKYDNHKPTKHVVFLHGYGASAGAFSRNFGIIDKLKDLNYNYKIHFLDNITFGLSSNPKIKSPFFRSIIKKSPKLKLNDFKPTVKKHLHRRYYKLIDSYEVDVDKFKKYKQDFIPALQDLEAFYLKSLDSWRHKSGIEKIDFLVGHSFGGYWSASYALAHPERVSSLILLSPVGMERNAEAVTTPIEQITKQPIKPTLDPTSYQFLSRLPILLRDHISKWYYYVPYLPRLAKFMGPWGVSKYYHMRYARLFKVNNVIKHLGGHSHVCKNEADLLKGSDEECDLLFEYLYNSITCGSHSDIYIKYLLTPSTTSKWPLYDKFIDCPKKSQLFKLHLVYGEFDFMDTEAGIKLIQQLNSHYPKLISSEFHKIPQGGHNLYLDNPFHTNNTLYLIIKSDD